MKTLDEAREPHFREFLKACNNWEVCVSMGCSYEMLEEIDRDKFRDDLKWFMEAYDIEDSEYPTVVDFYNKVYQNFRAQQPDGGQVHKRDPEVWALRKQFLKRCGVKPTHNRKSHKHPKAVWYMVEAYGFSWHHFDVEKLPDEALAYIVSNAALAVADKDARGRTFDYMWDEMEDSTLYELYKGVKNFTKLAEA